MIIKRYGKPTKHTEGSVGDICIDMYTGNKYKCESVSTVSNDKVVRSEHKWCKLKDDGIELIVDFDNGNLYDKNHPDILKGLYASGWNDEAIKVSSSGNSLTHYIPVKEGHTYICKTSYYGVSRHGYTLLYDKDKNNIDFTSTLRAQYLFIDTTVSKQYFTIIIPPGVAYIRTNMSKSWIETTVIVEGDEPPTEYVEHGTMGFTDEAQKMVADIAKEQTKLILQETQIVSPLSNKILAVDGDSMSSGVNGISYADIIAERMNMTLDKKASGGATITAEIYNDSGTARHWICRGIESLRPDADYVLIQGGANDVANKVALGSISNGYESALDDTTFCGAMENLCKQLYIKFHGKKVGFIMRHKASTTGYTNIDTTNGYYHKQKEILEKWGVPYIELGLLMPPFRYIEGLEELYTTDGSHMSQLGYEKYWVDKIIAFMESL